MEKFSMLSLAKHALSRHKNWPQQWRSPEPKPHYDVVIIGGGGHGLATAYYLAKHHGVTNVAVLEKGWLGGGNTGRNTTVVRSNYFYPQSTRFFDHSLQLQGVDAEMLTTEQIAERCPVLDCSAQARYPIWGGFIQHQGGVVRHDAVAWGYVRAALKDGECSASCGLTTDEQTANVINIDTLQTEIEDSIQHHHVAAASIAVFYKGVLTTASAGVSNVTTGVTLTSDTVIHLSSTTKVFNATLIMQFVDEGRVKFDASILCCICSLNFECIDN